MSPASSSSLNRSPAVAHAGGREYDSLMNSLDFKVFLERDEDYGGYVVRCPSIQGCYSQGKTVEEALANIREAIELCLEDMESRGEPLPEPNNVLIGSVLVNR
jgi:predicted RNase H-like HicB family nuclease